MSTIVSVRLGVFEKHTGRNEWYEHHGDLFQPHDLIELPVSESESKPRPVLCKPFRGVLERIALLGVCEQSVRMEFEKVADEHAFFEGDNYDAKPRKLDFQKFLALVVAIDTSSVDDSYVYEKYDGYAKFFQEELAPTLNLELSSLEAESADEILAHMSANSVLWLLAQNEKNLDHDLVWDFADHVDAGYSTTEEHLRAVRREHRFLIVTEGSSDGAILEKAFQLRRPEIADFFYFIDVEKEKFPFPGHGGLRNFCRSLITINVLNQTVVLFDNDAAARVSFNEAAKMALPINMRVLLLPNHPSGLLFETVGPDGESKADIDGRAAAIETYLDLSKGPQVRIRWKHFEESIGEYHGELENKQVYAQAFYDLAPGVPYDFSNLEPVLDAVVD